MFRRVLEGVSRGPFKFKTPSNQNAFKNPSKTLQEGVEINDALGFPGLEKSVPGSGGPVAVETKELGCCGPGKSSKTRKSPKVVRGGSKGLF